MRDLGVYEKVDEKGAVEKYGVTPADTKWVDTDEANQIMNVCERVQK